MPEPTPSITLVQSDDPAYIATAILVAPDGLNFANFGVTPEMARKLLRELNFYSGRHAAKHGAFNAPRDQD